MLTEIEVVEETVRGLDFATFSRNPQALRVVLYSFAVIGEAVASSITELKDVDNSMPWTEIRGMRNMVIHEYFRVDMEMIWETVKTDLPMLKKSLLRIQDNLNS